ncbi:enoyl-CoA hydratase/isomerase family protein (plasmid) [Rhizobium sp. 32-5/1]|uniref:enoyl-CoA hydratase/isomerase family protein n=1 Tax=Rhizobium sp. 32-5/1 TaxID=3019602 RepID=UPI00240CF0AC|nr:enoyl-CoA hydratase/isomerase family protein [Rhizobium sp. 32-5/1]WEZ86162.1 enoyl-CoA hydratase/isomerase family protein [Rhizobium sp. 32-5/1]
MTGATEEQLIKLQIDAAIAILTFNRPAKLNAFNEPMVEQLAATCRVIERSPDVRVVIVTGEGKAFCAGGDIEAWGAKSALDFGRFWLREGHSAFDLLARLRQPVIAVLNGHALGGGLELAALADMRIAEDHVKVGLPEAGIGVIPGWSGTQRAVRRFGSQIVRRMAVFGEVFSAAQAQAFGIVDHVVPKGEGMQRALAIAKLTTERAPVATEFAKMLVNAAEGEERERVLEALAGIAAAGTADLAEGVAAFKDKRKPEFKGL